MRASIEELGILWFHDAFKCDDTSWRILILLIGTSYDWHLMLDRSFFSVGYSPIDSSEMKHLNREDYYECLHVGDV